MNHPHVRPPERIQTEADAVAELAACYGVPFEGLLRSFAPW